MHHQGIVAPAKLRDTIQGFWYTRINLAEFPAGFEIVPDGSAEIIFHFGSSCSITTDGGLEPLPSPFLMGLLNQPVRLHGESQLEVIGVRCFPWTVFDLLGLPAGGGGVRTFVHPIVQLQPELAKLIMVGRVEEALAQVQQYFLETRPPMSPDSTLSKAGGAMRAAGGTLPVSQVAAAAHATVRTLERKFKQAAGFSVKDVSGLLRFEQARNHLWRHPEANLAALAYELGYTDQSHLSREFKRYSGTTPAAFARNARQRQQGVQEAFVAFVQA
ncbi:helix-turn-helix domain-containing protein [Hymenobacter wooponensis]|uniref:AraC family transcriptional regulator n=1 Tax=Hymenobacter wooponensis TaxID=1525360 RepID=A0A4Z0MSR6_9BACT|nr:helix-turn-helix domain-containing protein [Hymenobacter wooponensis]TGD82489.1 AraC family transcriptional regulator [Hymenobacter wooponensis]